MPFRRWNNLPGQAIGRDRSEGIEDPRPTPKPCPPRVPQSLRCPYVSSYISVTIGCHHNAPKKRNPPKTAAEFEPAWCCQSQAALRRRHGPSHHGIRLDVGMRIYPYYLWELLHFWKHFVRKAQISVNYVKIMMTFGFRLVRRSYTLG